MQREVLSTSLGRKFITLSIDLICLQRVVAKLISEKPECQQSYCYRQRQILETVRLDKWKWSYSVGHI